MTLEAFPSSLPLPPLFTKMVMWAFGAKETRRSEVWGLWKVINVLFAQITMVRSLPMFERKQLNYWYGDKTYFLFLFSGKYLEPSFKGDRECPRKREEGELQVSSFSHLWGNVETGIWLIWNSLPFFSPKWGLISHDRTEKKKIFLEMTLACL